jgi:AcrR family transcriptional regulator
MGRISLKGQRQREIVEAFYAVAKKTGLENASIAKVADHMGINPSLVLHYFKTRETLLEALVNFILEQYKDIYKINGHDYTTRKEVIRLINNLYSRKWNRLFDDGVFYSCYALTYRNKKLRHSFKSLHDSLRALLVDALGKAKINGIIHIRDERKTGAIVFALLEGAYYYLGMLDSAKARDKQMRVLKKQAIVLLGL